MTKQLDMFSKRSGKHRPLIPDESWEVAARADAPLRWWQWGTTEPLVIGAWASGWYWKSYVVLPRGRT